MPAQVAIGTTLEYMTSSMWVSAGELTQVTTNFSRDEIDTTHLSTPSLARTKLPSWSSSEFSGNIRFSSADTELYTLFSDAVVCDWKANFGDNDYELVGEGFITSLEITSETEGLVEASITIAISGPVAEDATPS